MVSHLCHTEREVIRSSSSVRRRDSSLELLMSTSHIHVWRIKGVSCDTDYGTPCIKCLFTMRIHWSCLGPWPLQSDECPAHASTPAPSPSPKIIQYRVSKNTPVDYFKLFKHIINELVKNILGTYVGTSFRQLISTILPSPPRPCILYRP